MKNGPRDEAHTRKIASVTFGHNLQTKWLKVAEWIGLLDSSVRLAKDAGNYSLFARCRLKAALFRQRTISDSEVCDTRTLLHCVAQGNVPCQSKAPQVQRK